MTTDKQTEANRQNAQKSTGPRTAEGKARSSMNHLTTGIDAKSTIIPGEDPAALLALIDRYIARFQPVTNEERHQVDILIHCDWKSQRYVRCEADVWSSSMEGPLRRKEPNAVGYGYSLCTTTLARLDRRVEVNERLYTRALHELERLQANRFAAEAPIEVQADDAADPAPQPAETAEPAPQPAETTAPAEELASNVKNAPSPTATPSSSFPGPEGGKPAASEGPHHPPNEAMDTPKSA